MKKMLLVTALLLMFAPAAFADEATTAVADQVDIVVADQTANAPEAVEDAAATDTANLDALLPGTALDIATQQAAAAYECPPYSDYCWYDRQCDAQCGAGAGVCSNGCCYCAF